MAIYQLGFQTLNTVAGAPDFEIVASNGSPMSILEIGYGPAADVQLTATYGRPSNSPVGGSLFTAAAPSGQPPGSAGSNGGVILNWTGGTAPAIPASGHSLQTFRSPSVAATRVSWISSWLPGELIVWGRGSNGGLVIWNADNTFKANVWLKWEE